jgi:hypothetical protein
MSIDAFIDLVNQATAQKGRIVEKGDPMNA